LSHAQFVFKAGELVVSADEVEDLEYLQERERRLNRTYAQ
tara:strand:+ start:562 stop:681 length:120 start_codon:yes stop_codon:yes gene_type:complete